MHRTIHRTIAFIEQGYRGRGIGENLSGHDMRRSPESGDRSCCCSLIQHYLSQKIFAVGFPKRYHRFCQAFRIPEILDDLYSLNLPHTGHFRLFRDLQRKRTDSAVLQNTFNKFIVNVEIKQQQRDLSRLFER